MGAVSVPSSAPRLCQWQLSPPGGLIPGHAAVLSGPQAGSSNPLLEGSGSFQLGAVLWMLLGNAGALWG